MSLRSSTARDPKPSLPQHGSRGPFTGTPITLTCPHRLAEEYAMLDVMSGGRLECAFPLGTS